MKFAGLEAILGHKFKDKALLEEAVTHRSYLNEDVSRSKAHNERLEFLGDAVLELIVTEELFYRYPDYTEGQMTPIRSALVNYQMMADVGKSIGMDAHILLSRGEAKDMGRGREVIVANAMESVIGALHLDGGYAAAKYFVDKTIMARLDEVMRRKLYKDPKSVLQEKVQEEKKVTPTYHVLKETGPDHAKLFTVGAYFGDELMAEGSGMSKQDAEIEAARNALGKLGF